MACKKDHSNLIEEMSKLPTSQGGPERHKCAGCAYEKGLEDGKNLLSVQHIDNILSSLEYSQAGAQRHKNARVAYALGVLDGICTRIKIKDVFDENINSCNSGGFTQLLIHPSSGINNVTDSVIGKLSEVWPEGAKKLVIVDSYFYHPYTRDNESVKDLFGNIMSRLHERGLDEVGVVCSTRSTGNQSDFTAIASSHSIFLSTLKNTEVFHDRFWYFPGTDKGIIVGTSLNGLNNKYCLTEVLDGNDVREIESVVSSL